MHIHNRNDIKDFILLLEDKFPVNDWIFNEIHLWPLIRFQLFFYLRKQLYQKREHQPSQMMQAGLSPVKESNKLFRFLRKIKRIFLYFQWKSGITSKKYVFVAQNAHRVNYLGRSYNRFFDALIDQEHLEADSYVIESGNKPVTDLAHPDLVFYVDDALDHYREYYFLRNRISGKREIEVKLEGYDLFLDFLSKNEITQAFSKKMTHQHIRYLINFEYAVRIGFYIDLFRKMKPEKITILCYYNDLSLVAAANRLGIETVEMQHGAQTPAHMGYGSWSKLPVTGYDFLPRTYWCWVEQSKNTIKEWAEKNSLYKYFVGGNVWMDVWNQTNDGYPVKDFILYTLQPDSLTLEELFPVSLLKVIREQKHTWFIRLHPRQLSKLEEIRAYLEKEHCLDLVNINDATNDPLPVLLKNCLCHVTNSSASAIEAAMFNKKTILLHATGKLYYDDLLSDGSADFIPPDTIFKEKFELFIAQLPKPGI